MMTTPPTPPTEFEPFPVVENVPQALASIMAMAIAKLEYRHTHPITSAPCACIICQNERAAIRRLKSVVTWLEGPTFTVDCLLGINSANITALEIKTENDPSHMPALRAAAERVRIGLEQRRRRIAELDAEAQQTDPRSPLA